MSISFSDLFAACERSILLLGRLRPDRDRERPDDQRRTADELAPLLAILGDFADDHEIDDGPLCDVRARLWRPADGGGGGCGGGNDGNDFGDAVAAAVQRVERIRTAVHVEGHRRLRAAMLGIW